MIILTDAEKDSDKSQHPFMIKKIKKTLESRHRGKLPQHNEGHVRQTQSKHSQQWKSKSISSKSRTRRGCPRSARLRITALKAQPWE